MKALVFGGAGFLGSHVVDELKSRGHLVEVYDIVNGDDIMDYASIRSAISGQDVVYNFAGQPDLTASTKDPRRTLELNIMGNMNILEAAKKAKIKRYVYASTVYVFSKKGSYYGISKQAAERCVEESGLPYTILRYGTVYGPRADEKNTVYRIIREALERGAMNTPTGVREFINVKDAARLSVDILDKEYERKHIILTGNESLDYKELVAKVAEILGWSDYPVCHSTDHYHLTPYAYRPDQSLKLMANPYIDLGQGLLETIEDISDRLKSKS